MMCSKHAYYRLGNCPVCLEEATSKASYPTYGHIDPISSEEEAGSGSEVDKEAYIKAVKEALQKVTHIHDISRPITEDTKDEGKKYDSDKAPMALIPPEAMEEEAHVWGMGAKKYGMWNFRSGLTYTRVLSALLRHAFALVAGQDIDPESGRHHAAHIRCCAGMLLVFRNRKELDDRYVKKEE